MIEYMNPEQLKIRIDKINAEMIAAAKKTDFIEAARLRDELLTLKEIYETKKEEAE